MVKTNTRFLDVNDGCPAMDFQLLDGTILHLPEGFDNVYGVILLYRGHW